jgi:hypothetical protein
MPQFLLRVEGVNLVNVIDDTDDLSTRRGGGLMILNAASQLNETLDPKYRSRLQAIATGASIGLFSFEAADEADAEDMRAAVVNHYRNQTLEYPIGSDGTGHLPLKWGTFVVDVVPVAESAARAEQTAVAKNRWRQMREPSLALAEVWEKAAKACEFDFARPATTYAPKGGRPRPASASVAERNKYGRHARQKFYRHELGEEIPWEFVDDLGTLAKLSGLGKDLAKDVAPPSTRDKIAIFYVDGNRFGEIGRGMWGKSEPLKAFREWSEAIRAHHRMLLRGLLERASQDLSWQNHRAIRLETLLWGGDEILWVVPAWKGWQLVEWFFGQPHQVTAVGEKRALTYGAGLVFCHHNAPIKNVIDLAHRLGDTAKDAAKKAGESSSHRVAYEVLESFDDVTGKLDDHRRSWLPKVVPVEKLVLDPAALCRSWESLRRIADSPDFPMRQLHALVKAWRNGKDFQTHRKRLDECGVRDSLEAFRASIGDDVAWLHLLQILPYFPTIEAVRSTGG